MRGIIKEKQGFRVDSVGVFLLGAVFLFLSIGLVLLGGSVYSHIIAGSARNDDARTTFSYLANQVRRADSGAGVEIGYLGEQQALLLNHDYAGWAFVTYLYYYDGALRELFVEKGYELEPEAGLPIVWLEDIRFSIDGAGLITAKAFFSDNREEQMLLSTRTNTP